MSKFSGNLVIVKNVQILHYAIKAVKNQEMKIIFLPKERLQLLYMSQVFVHLQCHLHFFLYFFYTLVGHFFSGQTLSAQTLMFLK